MPITFHTEQTQYILKQKRLHKRWIKQWIISKQALCGELSIVFTSNTQIKSLNRSYLNHDYYTDVITFDYREGNIINGDMFISIDQVRINAKEYDTQEDDELRRVMIHGVNHLLGYGDSNEEEREIMRQMENEALHLWLKMV